ncbi:magnesium/cobalt transporter CorA [Dehalobacter sp. DCM]|uniref:magnesium/cobalt transporter CorA n=1 Tax=Dehalobacter sp. DCM TaxID=2907827 RepID=UPI00308132B4|nr:magnesium/cobalt transporter CorA [Dehalobacter sp. DCM]
MIYTLALSKESQLLQNLTLEQLTGNNISWYWVDFESPDQEEAQLLSDHFKFHPLAIEDCLENLERPKVDYYDTYTFFIFQALGQNTLDPVEIDLFVGENYIVTFHKSKLEEISSVRQKITDNENIRTEGPTYLAYLILDKIVDRLFPAVYSIEDYLNEIDIRSGDRKFSNLIDQVFDLRADLLKLRHIVNSTKELLYRMLNSDHLKDFKKNKRDFNDIYDHLLQLADTVESSREVTKDIRDSYLSINSHRMNKIMTILTIITSIFIPLTFIVGIYGMNFDYMPELRWRYGYFYVLGIMAFIGISMLLWFKRKGWFNMKK